MTGLRERRHEETRRAIVGAAFELFADRGFAEVTMDEIAQAAGVSRSTAYRRFPTKEDIVLDAPRRWLVAFDAAIPEQQTLRDSVRAACLAVAQYIDDDPKTVLTAYSVLDEAPTLRSSSLADQAWLDRFADMIDRSGDVDPDTAPLIAGAYLGALDAMMQSWARAGGTTSVVAATEHLLDRLEPILP